MIKTGENKENNNEKKKYIFSLLPNDVSGCWNDCCGSCISSREDIGISRNTADLSKV